MFVKKEIKSNNTNVFQESGLQPLEVCLWSQFTWTGRTPNTVSNLSLTLYLSTPPWTDITDISLQYNVSPLTQPSPNLLSFFETFNFVTRG